MSKNKNINWEQLIKEVILLNNENEKKNKKLSEKQSTPTPINNEVKITSTNTSKDKDIDIDIDTSNSGEHNIKPSKNTSSMFVESKVIPLCPSTTAKQNFIKGPLVCNFPVVLCELKLQIDCESEIKFSKPVLNIIDIKSNVNISEYKLILTANKLFISGYIRESIQYTNPSRKLKHLTVKIPFECVTKIEFTTPPIIHENKPTSKYSFIDCMQENNNLTEDFSEDLFFSSNHSINEKIFCELLSSEVIQLITKIDVVTLEKVQDTAAFQRVKQKTTLDLLLRLHQNQLVGVNFPGNT